ncbi:MAG: tetratricopeptide repeat protein, partial [Pseudomonadota bacterium]
MKFPFRRPIVMAIAGLLTASVHAQSDEFRAGQDALAKEQYERAIEAFESARRKHASEEAAALYWEAYALMQEGRARQAEQRIRRLERDHENSPWLDDAQALLYSGNGEAASDEALDEELRLYALSALMDRNPERA